MPGRQEIDGKRNAVTPDDDLLADVEFDQPQSCPDLGATVQSDDLDAEWGERYPGLAGYAHVAGDEPRHREQASAEEPALVGGQDEHPRDGEQHVLAQYLPDPERDSAQERRRSSPAHEQEARAQG